MSFPDDFEFPEDQPMTTVAKQVGNAVPPLLARTLAKSLAALLDQDHDATTSDAVAA